MKLSLHCPTCSRPIALSPQIQQISCPACGSEFGVVYGKLSKHTSLPETLLYLTARLPQIHKHHYTFQITTPDRTLQQLQFSTPGKVDSVPAQAGDLISVLYTLQSYGMRSLVAISNHTTGKGYVLPRPIPSGSHLTTTVGTAILAVLLASYFIGLNLFLAGSVSAVGALMYLKLTNMAQLSSPALQAQGREGNRLLADQRLLGQKRRIEARMGELEHDCKANQMLINQLATLKRKMQTLDQSLYVTRIDRADRAVNLIEQQNINNQCLMREYGQAAKMIEIEVETSWIADQLPESSDFISKILRKLDELKSIESQNQALKLQLTAYDELRSGV
ncbi:MAG TPA: hypothetical protein V6D18_06330 [Thermosynechococcaceae cyanobacterium]